MLDRKTKHIDASIELLEDRKKDIKRFENLWLILFAFCAIIGLVGYGAGMNVSAILILIVSCWCLLRYNSMQNEKIFIATIIYFKKLQDIRR